MSSVPSCSVPEINLPKGANELTDSPRFSVETSGGGDRRVKHAEACESFWKTHRDFHDAAWPKNTLASLNTHMNALVKGSSVLEPIIFRRPFGSGYRKYLSKGNAWREWPESTSKLLRPEDAATYEQAAKFRTLGTGIGAQAETSTSTSDDTSLEDV